MKKLLLLVICTFYLSGCVWQTVTKSDWKAGELKCKTFNAEVDEIISNFMGQEWVHCSNRMSYVI